MLVSHQTLGAVFSFVPLNEFRKTSIPANKPCGVICFLYTRNLVSIVLCRNKA
jgi:hypothetical protein